MKKLVKQIWKDDAGVVLSSELVLILTIAVLSLVVGLSEIAAAVNLELNDLSNALGAISQSFRFTGFASVDNGKDKSFAPGTTFLDTPDDCDINTTTDLVTGASATTTTEGQ